MTFPLQLMALVLHTPNINQSGKKHGELQTEKTRLGRFLGQYGKDEDKLIIYCEYLQKFTNNYTSSNQRLGSAGARLLRDARHKRHRSLHSSTCRMDSNATKARLTLRRVAEQLLILENEGQ